MTTVSVILCLPRIIQRVFQSVRHDQPPPTIYFMTWLVLWTYIVSLILVNIISRSYCQFSTSWPGDILVPIFISTRKIFWKLDLLYKSFSELEGTNVGENEKNKPYISIYEGRFSKSLKVFMFLLAGTLLSLWNIMTLNLERIPKIEIEIKCY